MKQLNRNLMLTALLTLGLANFAQAVVKAGEDGPEGQDDDSICESGLDTNRRLDSNKPRDVPSRGASNTSGNAGANSRTSDSALGKELPNKN